MTFLLPTWAYDVIVFWKKISWRLENGQSNQRMEEEYGHLGAGGMLKEKVLVNEVGWRVEENELV